MNIAVLLGGMSPERNVSFASGKAIAEALRGNGHDVVTIDPSLGANGVIDLNSIPSMESAPTVEELQAFNPKRLFECVQSPIFDDIDIAFLGLHGKYGEDGYIQSLLDLRGIRYTGSKMLASAVAMDKAMSKHLFESARIPTPEWVTLQPHHADDYDLISEIRKDLGGELVIKPNDQGSTVGMSIVLSGNVDDIRNGIREAGKYSNVIVVERYIPGIELTVAVLGAEALPIVEIRPEGGFYDYRHKYTKGHTQYICPAELDEYAAEFIQNLAVGAHSVLGCSAYSRVDFRVDEDGHPFCLEVNTLPGFTSTSLVPKAAAAAGISFGDLCEKIIELS